MRVADPSCHVLRKPKPTSRHRAGAVVLQEPRLILARPGNGSAFALVRAGNLEDRRCLGEASRPAPLVCRFERLQGVLSSPSLLAKRVEDVEKCLLGKIGLHRAKPDLALLHIAGFLKTAYAAFDGGLLKIATPEHHLHGVDIIYPKIIERLRTYLASRLALILPAIAGRLVGVVEFRVIFRHSDREPDLLRLLALNADTPAGRSCWRIFLAKAGIISVEVHSLTSFHDGGSSLRSP